MSSPSSKLQAPSSCLIGIGLVWALAAPVVAQKQIFSTHDWTPSDPPHELFYNDAWADVKMPGGFPEFGTVADSRRTYAVGQTEVHQTVSGSFSGQTASPPAGLGFSLTNASDKRQVVVLQATNCGDNSIAWQSYFYGETGPSQFNLRATNARAVSVWEAEEPSAARIAICGETYDERIPLSQNATGWSAADGSQPSGFIAVFDGTGALKWTYHFFAGNDPNLAGAVTDISIRVDDQGNDVVTYCGISTHGLATSGTSYLNPILAFPSPGVGLTSGATNQGTGQWDGFVGRLVRAGTSAATRQFHSIVGGAGTDGLFGIAEINPDFFAVVGFSETTQTSGSNFFPFKSRATQATPYRYGALLVFDASQVPSGDLAISSDVPIGTGNTEKTTFARDVCVGFDALVDPWHKVYVVGSTSDSDFNLLGLAAPPVAGAAMSGPSDGFVYMTHVYAGALGGAVPMSYSYWGGTGEDGLTGVNNWNEFSEHIGTVGFTDRQGTMDIGVSTWFCNESFGGNVPPGSVAVANNGFELILLRDTTIGATDGSDLPAGMGAQSIVFDTDNLGREAGGGIAVGNDGRINAVGYTDGTDYPVFPAASSARPRDYFLDAVRTEVDMLPPAVGSATTGIGRTDGTGFLPPGTTYPPRNGLGQVIFSGGTTPTCGVRPFGRRVGESEPILQRMLIDYEGTPPTNGVNDLAIIVSRPTVYASTVAAGVLQIGLPPAVPWVTIGADFWLAGPGAIYLPTYAAGTTAFRLPLSPLPSSGTGQFSAQLICLLDLNPVTLASGCASAWTASPAIWFEF